MLPDVVTEKLEALPLSSGVYLFKDKKGTVVYVGKAKVLRSRVAIADGTAVLPEALWASYSAPALVPPSWVSSLAEHEALVRTTCAGCHAEAAEGFHVDPLANGSQAPALSRFLADPTKEVDELRRRIEVMQLTLTRPE